MTLRRSTETIVADITATPRFTIVGLAAPPWTEHAACASVDNDIFFPEKGGSTREAKAVCARCPVQAECLDYAIEHEERFGIWGGLSERERRRIADALAEHTTPEPVVCALSECGRPIVEDVVRPGPPRLFCCDNHAAIARSRRTREQTA